ncbi:hypothetical protein POM88_047495 [Heracleum sosnowskyi]|uniref:Uncharacterized protein n=1 Tax=Heracleum sosnowskyi TaxID=360622 RepID=A0AAD8GU05_9APIA|nr:hypothetical protein POM88_047495 [Heracleum sosnowskyi]
MAHAKLIVRAFFGIIDVLIDAHTYILQKYVGGVFLIELAVVGLVSGLVIGLVDDVVLRTGLVGALATVFGILAYIPLHSGLLNREESVEHMPFGGELISILNALCWIIYASLRFDVCLLFSCCCVISLEVLHLSLRVHSDDKKKQLQEIDTGDDKKLCTAEVQS